VFKKFVFYILASFAKEPEATSFSTCKKNIHESEKEGEGEGDLV
jgi:hypothetical protein